MNQTAVKTKTDLNSRPRQESATATAHVMIIPNGSDVLRDDGRWREEETHLLNY